MFSVFVERCLEMMLQLTSFLKGRGRELPGMNRSNFPFLMRATFGSSFGYITVLSRLAMNGKTAKGGSGSPLVISTLDRSSVSTTTDRGRGSLSRHLTYILGKRSHTPTQPGEETSDIYRPKKTNLGQRKSA